jgi:cell wall-associated NlpC family hydrolase
MTLSDPRLATVATWIGRSYADMNRLYPSPDGAWEAGLRGCWNLARAAYRLRGVELPPEYHVALDQRMFRTVFDPEPWDLVPFCIHKLPIVTHVALYLGDDTIVHAVQDAGVVAHPITRLPFWNYAARDEKGRHGYLRLRHIAIAS